MPEATAASVTNSVHELWAEPSENWLDHFIHVDRLRKLFEGTREERWKKKDEISRLLVQFAEQATATEKETAKLVEKQFGQEDVSFNERKSACLWLCAFACVAACDWQLNGALNKVEDILVLKEVLRKLDEWTNDPSLFASTAATAAAGDAATPSAAAAGTTPVWTFGALIVARWRLLVDNAFRVPPPPAKQSVSNPCNQLDAVLTRFEQSNAVLAEVRTKVEASQQVLESFIASGATLEMPLPECFLKPFTEEGGMSLSVGIVGLNVLVEGLPVPRLNEATEKLPTVDVARRCRLDLIASYLNCGQFTATLKHLKQVVVGLPPVASSPNHLMCAFDRRTINGYCAAFRLPPPYSDETPSTSKEETDLSRVNNAMLDAPQCSPHPQRRYATRRDRLVMDTSLRLDPALFIRARTENAADDMATGMPVVGWRLKISGLDPRIALQPEATAKALMRVLNGTARISPSTHVLVRATARFLTASLPVMATALKSAGAEALLTGEQQAGQRVSLDHLKTPLLPNPPPTMAALRSMAASDKPYWTLLTSFDAGELKAAFAMEQGYRRPHLLKFPDLLAEAVLSTRPPNELAALLLGKLQQLTDIGDYQRWQGAVNGYAPLIGLDTNQAATERLIYEATRVHILSLNRKLLTPHCDLKGDGPSFLLGLVKGIQRATQFPSLVVPMLSFLLNNNEWKYVMQSLDPGNTQMAVLNAARILAAFGTAPQALSSSAAGRQVVDTWHKMVSPFFESQTTKRRADGGPTVVRDAARTRGELINLFKNIKNPDLQSFLLSYFAHLYTQALSTRGRSHLKVYVELSQMLPPEMSLQLASLASLEEVLTALLTTAYSVSPSNAAWLRTKADFAYVRSELDEAAPAYMETLFAVSPCFTLPVPEKIVDESVWAHIRICLRKYGQHTLAACICQLFKTGRAKEFRKAAEAIQDRVCMDASDEFFGLIYDHQLGEYLSDMYSKKGQQHQVDAMIQTLARPCMNINNGPEIVAREMALRQTRLLRVLAAQFFSIHF